MTWGKIQESVSTSGPHHFATHKPLQMNLWLKNVANEYVKLRTECTIELPATLDLSGIGVLDASNLQTRLAKALVPKADTHRKAFSVTRSDLSEVAAYMLLERSFDTEIAYKPVRDRELIQLPGRGIDAVGIEVGEKLMVVLGEVKFSDENSSPKAPQVVDVSKDCMRTQHLGHISEIDQTISKIWDCARRAKDPKLQELLFAAAIYLEDKMTDAVEIVSCCVLVRPEARHSAGDFGTFKDSPEKFSPANVRFLVWVLPGDIDSILADWVAAVEAERLAV
jgi:hypothetical protein